MVGSLIGTVSTLTEKEIEELKRAEIKKVSDEGKTSDGKRCDYVSSCPILELRLGASKGIAKPSCKFPDYLRCIAWSELKSEEVYHNGP